MSEKMDGVRAKVSNTATRAKEAVVGTASRAGDAASGAAGRVSDTAPSRGEVKQQTRQVAGMAKENPLGLAIGAAALGFLAGLAVPSTQVEDEKLGPVVDQVKDRVKQTGQEALDRGKQVAQEVASSATGTAKESAQEHAQELADSAKQSAQDVRPRPAELTGEQPRSPTPADLSTPRRQELTQAILGSSSRSGDDVWMRRWRHG